VASPRVSNHRDLDLDLDLVLVLDLELELERLTEEDEEEEEDELLETCRLLQKGESEFQARQCWKG
jgi:hypothetical protein